MGTISMRRMAKFHDAINSFYLNIGIGLSSVMMVYILGQGWEPIKNWGPLEWFVSFMTGFTGVTSQTMRFVALKYQKASTLQLLAPLTTLWQVIFDITIPFLGTHFTWEQIASLIGLFLIYILQALKFLLYDKPKQKKRDAAKIAEIKRFEELAAQKVREQLELNGQLISSRDSETLNVRTISQYTDQILREGGLPLSSSRRQSGNAFDPEPRDSNFGGNGDSAARKAR